MLSFALYHPFHEQLKKGVFIIFNELFMPGQSKSLLP